MEVIGEGVKKRRDAFFIYRMNLNEHEGIKFLEEPDESYFSNRWLTALLVDPSKTGITREVFQKELEKENIVTRPLLKPMYLKPVFLNVLHTLKGYSKGYPIMLFVYRQVPQCMMRTG
jgi:dTDP-4-amino-4,6-dideoxygalactose transaminase